MTLGPRTIQTKLVFGSFLESLGKLCKHVHKVLRILFDSQPFSHQNLIRKFLKMYRDSALAQDENAKTFISCVG